LREYISNMAYAGILAQMLGIDLEKIRDALDIHFKGKKEAVDINFQVVELAATWAATHLEKRDPYRVEPMQQSEERILADGNTAGALGAIFGGVQFAAWYPITPATGLAEALHEYLPLLRKDPLTNKDTYAIVQAEDEIAAIGMAVGAGWSGLRAMTSTSGPGLSLMAEYLGLAYFTETPLVVWDVQRVGPSTGLPTRTAQGDLTFANFLSHGDTRYILLIPGSPHECFEFGWKSFDLAERLQTPVIVMSDLDLGMNQWISAPFDYPDVPMDRGKILWEDDFNHLFERTDGQWVRYLDIDGDGIPYRTLPGNRDVRSVYFARGTGHNEYGQYTEDPLALERLLERLDQKFQHASKLTPKPIVQQMDGANIGIIGCGSTDCAIHEARFILAQHGIPSDYLRVRALPINEEVSEFIENHDRNYVVEVNRDGQLKQLLTLAVPHRAMHFRQVSHIDGMPLAARWIVEKIRTLEEAE
ncbi:MAG: 2-oxoacid:acceptor oxidoreductase subunit alpha, partial [Anaerolineaceae bacterium]|nr:2-oxoacid:acceptor oxidoreductase subunit alpha [Anaerolineaceae bacterium]